MALINVSRQLYAISAIAFGCLFLSACNGTDVYIDAPILDAAGINLTSKKADDENLPERPGIVIPPSTQSLPEPGTQTATAEQNWPQDPDQIKARKAQEAAEAEERYCNGEWKEKSNITEFERDAGVEARCSSKLGKAISKQLGGG